MALRFNLCRVKNGQRPRSKRKRNISPPTAPSFSRSPVTRPEVTLDATERISNERRPRGERRDQAKLCLVRSGSLGERCPKDGGPAQEIATRRTKGPLCRSDFGRDGARQPLSPCGLENGPAVPAGRLLDAEGELGRASSLLAKVRDRSDDATNAFAPRDKAGPFSWVPHKPRGDRVRGDVRDLVLDVALSHQTDDVARLRRPKVLPLALRRVHRLRREAMQLAEEVGQDAARIGHYKVKVIRHHACGMEAHASLLHRKGEAVHEDPVRFRARSETKGPLRAAARNEVCLRGNDAARVGHDAATRSEQCAWMAPADFRGFPRVSRVHGWHGRFGRWHGRSRGTPRTNLVTVLSTRAHLRVLGLTCHLGFSGTNLVRAHLCPNLVRAHRPPDEGYLRLSPLGLTPPSPPASRNSPPSTSQ
jgi:hypothetical protein